MPGRRREGDDIGGRDGDALRERRAPAPPPPIVKVLDLQRSAGNQATSALLARKGKKHGGVEVEGFRNKRAVSSWQSAVDNEDADKAKAAAKTLAERDEDTLVGLYLHKLEKHAGDQEHALRYSNSLPLTTKFKALERSWRERRTAGARALAPLIAWLFKDEPDRVVDLVLDVPRDFFEIGVPTLREGKPEFLIQLLQNQQVMTGLRAADPDSLDELIAATPMLRAVEHSEQVAGPAANQEALADQLFQSLIHPGTVSVGYSATATGSTQDVLLGHGPTAPGQAQVLKPKSMLDCHHLAYVFADMVRAHPGLQGMEITGDNLYEPVLTVPLNTLPGGLIPNSFTGNVFDDTGAPTGQIFFSGALGMDSHTWPVVGGKPYDPLFGTMGDQVAAAVAGKFVRIKGKEDAYKEEGGAGRYMIKRPDLAVPQNEHGFASGYVVTTRPDLYDLDPATVELSEADLAEGANRRRRKGGGH